MADFEAPPPKLGDIPQQSAFEVPTLGANAHSETPSAPIQSIETDHTPMQSSQSSQPATSSLTSAKETVANSEVCANFVEAAH